MPGPSSEDVWPVVLGGLLPQKAVSLLGKIGSSAQRQGAQAFPTSHSN